MGFKTLRNLSVLLLTSAALVGCNNGPAKDKSLGAGPKLGDPPGLAQKNQNQPLQGTNQPFPTLNKQGANTQPNLGGSPFAPQGGAPSNAFAPGGAAPTGGAVNTGFTPGGAGPIGAPPPNFAPIGAGNSNPAPYPNINPPAPPTSGFATGRSEPTPPVGAFPGGPAIPQPAGFPGRN